MQRENETSPPRCEYGLCPETATADLYNEVQGGLKSVCADHAEYLLRSGVYHEA